MTKILLVEDNEMNRDMLARRLVRRGYEVVCAVDGEEAITKAQSESPALILMDMSLPRLNGWDATRRLRQAGQRRLLMELQDYQMRCLSLVDGLRDGHFGQLNEAGEDEVSEVGATGYALLEQFDRSFAMETEEGGSG